MLLAVLPAFSVEAQRTSVSDEIQVEGWPDPLPLGYGETEEFNIVVHNVGGRTLGIHMEWVSCECIYGHGGSVSESYLRLAPGASRQVTVTVTSGSRPLGDNDGEGMLRFEWGANLTMDGGRPDDSTVEDHGGIEINVKDVATSGPVGLGLVAIVVVLALVVILAFLRVRRRKDPGQG
jgi:hypothetical protein